MSTLEIILAGIGTGIGYITGRKKNKADVERVIAETRLAEVTRVEKIVGLWEGMVEELRTELNEVKVKCSELSKNLETMRQENEQMRKENKKLKDELHHLSKMLNGKN